MAQKERSFSKKQNYAVELLDMFRKHILNLKIWRNKIITCVVVFVDLFFCSSRFYTTMFSSTIDYKC